MIKRFIFLTTLLTGCSQFERQNDFSSSTQSVRLPKWNSENAIRSNKTTKQNFSIQWPVNKIKISRGFFSHQYKRNHDGLDLTQYHGAPIFAAGDGVVIYSGNGFRGYGNIVILKHNEEWSTLYAHLNKIMVSDGDELKTGEILGTMGKTGRATGTHLHFELIKDSLPVNPLDYLPSDRKIAKE
jgi:murein DD-endopeptidase MepM/ murein hydrolase activator NlpD